MKEKVQYWLSKCNGADKVTYNGITQVKYKYLEIILLLLLYSTWVSLAPVHLPLKAEKHWWGYFLKAEIKTDFLHSLMQQWFGIKIKVPCG